MSNKAALPVPYIIALIFGVILLVALGYWLTTQGTKVIGVGGATECQAKQQNFCQQWKLLSKFGTIKPFISFPFGCSEPSDRECAVDKIRCVCINSKECASGYEYYGQPDKICSGTYPYLCCPIE